MDQQRPITSVVGKRGVIVVPAELRRRYGLEEGTLVLAEARPEWILLRPAAAIPVEIYDDERKAEFLLSTAIDSEEYAWAREQVRKMGLDPDRIPHQRPPSAE